MSIKSVAKKIFIGFIAFMVFGTVITALVGPENVERQIAENKQVEEVTKAQYVFDVPSLLGKDIDELFSLLGKPSTHLEPKPEQVAVVDEWSTEFEKDGVTLLANYSHGSREVSTLFIVNNLSSDTNKSTNEQERHLLELGNLNRNGNYIVEFVKGISKPSYLTGVKVSE